jgi:phosphoribosylformimino-5-aminoimidazole carboxamide ribotide isomerase
MEIIPVIDIMGGKVVHARGGDRSSYPLLESVLTKHVEPIEVITDLLDWYPFSTFYIADLDAIEMQVDNSILYQRLVKVFPKVNFWLDVGIRTQENWQTLLNYSGITPVIASETLSESKWLLKEENLTNAILSLDFKKGRFLGDNRILQKPDLWTQRVIVMELDSVGEQAGPNITHLLELECIALDHQLIAAGGIRNKEDLITLDNHGVKQALVASALHDGSLTKSELDLILR